MSFILNALRKSEQERQALHPETVTDRILLSQPQQNHSKKTRFYTLLTIGNMLIMACIVWFVSHNLKTAPDTAIKAHSSPLPAQETTVRSKVIVNPIQAKRPLQNAGSKTTSIAEWVEEQKPEPAPLKVKPVATKKTMPETTKQTDDVKKSGAPVQIASENTAVVEVKPALPETVSVKKDIPFLSDLPAEFRQTVPKLNINVFVYAQQPEERFIMIDMVKYKPGQQIKEAMELKEIRPNSLVVVYRNRTFQIERQ